MKKRIALLLCSLMMLTALSACGASKTESLAGNTPTPTVSPASEPDGSSELLTTAPTPTEEPKAKEGNVNVGMLLVGLYPAVKEYGTAEMNLKLTLDVNPDEAQRKQLEENGILLEDGMSYTTSIQEATTVSCNEDAAAVQLKYTTEALNLTQEQTIEEYLQRQNNGEVYHYVYSMSDGTWKKYTESEVPDLTDCVGVGLFSFEFLSWLWSYEDVTLSEEKDTYVVDGRVSLKKFCESGGIASAVNMNGGSGSMDDLYMNIHMVFGMEDRKLHDLSAYLAETKPMSDTDHVGFREFNIDIMFDLMQNGAQVIIPSDVIGSAVVEN